MSYIIEHNDDRKRFDDRDEWATLKQLLDEQGREYRAFEQ